MNNDVFEVGDDESKPRRSPVTSQLLGIVNNNNRTEHNSHLALDRLPCYWLLFLIFQELKLCKKQDQLV